MTMDEAIPGAKSSSQFGDFPDKESSSNENLQARSTSRGRRETRSKRSDSNTGLPYFGTDNMRQIEGGGLGKEMVNSSLLPTSHERPDLVIGRMMAFNTTGEDSVGIQNSAGEP